MKSVTGEKQFKISGFLLIFIILYICSVFIVASNFKLNNDRSFGMMIPAVILSCFISFIFIMPYYLLAKRVFYGKIQIDSAKRLLLLFIIIFNVFCLISYVFYYFIKNFKSYTDYLILNISKFIPYIGISLALCVTFIITRIIYRFVFYLNPDKSNLILDNAPLLEAIKNNEFALESAPHDLKTNKEFIIEAVSQNGLALRFVPKCFKSDKQIVMAAAANNIQALKFASKELQDEIMISIVDL